MRDMNFGPAMVAGRSTVLLGMLLAGCASIEDRAWQPPKETASVRPSVARAGGVQRPAQASGGQKIAGWAQDSTASERRKALSTAEQVRTRRSTASRQPPVDEPGSQTWVAPQPEMQLDRPTTAIRTGPQPPAERPLPPARRELEMQRSSPAQPVPSSPPVVLPERVPAQPQNVPQPPPVPAVPTPAPPSRAMLTAPPAGDQMAGQSAAQIGKEVASLQRGNGKDGSAPPAASKADSSLSQVIQRAREMIRRGQVLKAREQLLAAVSQSPSETLLELGRTFDPHYLPSAGSADGQPEPQRARSLYEEAVKLGSTAAVRDLERLRRAHPSSN